MLDTNPPLRIDIISDVMCPWCSVGYRQLAIALEQTDVTHEIHWHPFELNPNMPQTGQDMREHVAEKYGATKEQSEANQQNLVQIGADVGATFNFIDGFRMHNTFNTHQLLHWADQQGLKNDLKQALFIAHFSDARDLSDIEILADIAAENGLDRSEAVLVLEDQRFAQIVRQEQKFWTEQGIQGVPAMVFDRQHLITGAQGVESYKNILDQVVNLAHPS